MLSHRRRVLGSFLAGVAAVLLPGKGTHGSTAAASQVGDRLQGTWLVAATLQGAQPGAPPRFLVSFTSDGRALRTPPPQQPAPPALGVSSMFTNTLHGEWQRTGDREFALMFVGFAFDREGNFLATQRVRAAPRLNETLDAFDGPASVDFVSDDGNILATVRATLHGTRIRIEPMG
jgi:hypothetical protein